VPRGLAAWLSILSFGIVITCAVVTGSRLDTDVFVQELFSSEIVHEVFSSDIASLLVSIFEQDLVQTLDDSLHDFLKSEVHRLLLLVVGSNVFAKLLVNFLDDSREPVANIRVSEFDLLVHLSGLLVQFLGRLDLDVKLMDFGVLRATTLHFEVILLPIVVLHLQLIELLSDLFILTSQVVQFVLIVTDGMQ